MDGWKSTETRVACRPHTHTLSYEQSKNWARCKKSNRLILFCIKRTTYSVHDDSNRYLRDRWMNSLNGGRKKNTSWLKSVLLICMRLKDWTDGRTDVRSIVNQQRWTAARWINEWCWIPSETAAERENGGSVTNRSSVLKSDNAYLITKSHRRRSVAGHGAGSPPVARRCGRWE